MILVSVAILSAASMISSPRTFGGLVVLAPRDQVERREASAPMRSGMHVDADGVSSNADGWSIFSSCDRVKEVTEWSFEFGPGSGFGLVRNCQGVLPPSEDPSFALYILDMESNYTMLQLVGEDIVCTHLDVHRGIWYVWEDGDRSPGVPCEPVSLRGKKRLTLDAAVLWGQKISLPSTGDEANLQVSSLAVQYCDYLQLMLFGPETVAVDSNISSTSHISLQVPSFVTMTGASSAYGQMSLWLDYCDLNPPQVQLRDSDLMLPSHDVFSVESTCSVHRVVGLEGYVSGFYSFTNDDIFSCLEEVMNVLEVVRLRRIDASSRELGIDGDGPPLQALSAIVYVSAFGLPPFPGTLHSDEFLQDAMDDYVRVIRAFYAADVRHLIISSSAFRDQFLYEAGDFGAIDKLCDIITNNVDFDFDTSQNVLNSVMPLVASDLALPTRRKGALRRLQFRLIEENYLTVFTAVQSAMGMLAAKQLFFSILNSTLDAPRMPSALFRTSPKDLEVSRNYIAIELQRNSTSAGYRDTNDSQMLRLNYADYINLLDVLGVRLLGGSSSTFQAARDLLPLAPSLLLMSYFKSVSVSDFQHVSGALSKGDCMPGSLKQSDLAIDILMVYVLIFVDRDALPETQYHVQKWKRRELLRSNLYIRYYTIQTPDRDFNGTSKSQLDFVGKHLRFSLLSTKHVLLDTAGKLDAVIVLNGIEAVRAFIAPHPDASKDTGIMPFPFEINPPRKIRLFRPVMFSGRGLSSQTGGVFDDRIRSECMVLCRVAFQTTQCPCSNAPLIDSRGFASTVSQFFEMFEFLESHSSGFHRGAFIEGSDDLSVHRALQIYTCVRPWDVGVDSEGRFFGVEGIPSASASVEKMSATTFESELVLELDTTAIESMRYCDLNYAATKLGPLIDCDSSANCFVNVSHLQRMDAEIFDDVGGFPVKLCKAVGLSYTAFLLLKPMEINHVPLSRFNWIATVFPMMAFNVTLLEKFSVIHAITSELRQVQQLVVREGVIDADSFRSHIRSLHLILSSMYQEIGPLQSALSYYHKSILAVDYKVYRRDRDAWKHRRQIYAESPVVAATTSGSSSSAGGAVPKVHIYTIATHHSPKLENLNFSVRLAGFELKLAGFGQPWGGLRCKYPYYREAVGADDTIVDDDILFLIDAYDTVMFPAFRNFPKLLSESPSPMLMCSENALYPEQLAAMSYPRGLRDSRVRFGHYLQDGTVGELSMGLSRFGNTGCMGGRAADVKRFLRVNDIWPHETYADDQLSGTRFAQGFPHVATVDSERAFFYSAYREIAGMNINYNALLKFETNLLPSHHNIGLLHCNGGSLPACDAAVQLLRSFHSSYFSGDLDGEVLLEAIRAFWEEDLARARQLLSHPAVQANASHNFLAAQLIRGFGI